MYRGKSVAVVIPAYNEEKLIIRTLENAPDIVDKMYVVNDCSTDSTPDLVRDYMKSDKRVELINHEFNKGLGAALVTGFKKAKVDNYDTVTVVGGDAQMDLHELPNFLDPLVDDRADFTKGNRFLHPSIEIMPRVRYIGNVLLSIIEKPVTGYWHIFDNHDGYMTMNKKVLHEVNWDSVWKGYCFNVDFLARFNCHGFRVMDIPRRAIYLYVEEDTPEDLKTQTQSQIKVLKYIWMAIPLITRTFLRRIRTKYLKF